MTVKEIKKILDIMPDDAELYRVGINRDGDPVEELIEKAEATFHAETVTILLS